MRFSGKLAAVLLLCSVTGSARAVVYEASSLHDAVGRSETVQDLFYDRWNGIIEREQYLDVYGKINWIPGFKVRTIDRATGEKKAVDMRLVRTYGSLTVAYPVIGGYEGKSISERLDKGKTKKSGASSSDGNANITDTKEDASYVQPKKLIAAFTMTGFHYGLTRATDISRGSAGTEVATDYTFTQFFDDIFAVSILYLPYVFVHGGVVMQNQVDPNPDGTMSYFNTKDDFPKYKYFFASNLFSFLNANATATKSKVEKIGGSLEFKTMVAGFKKDIPGAVPKVTLSYKMLNAFNDEGFSAVWVKSAYAKDGSIKNSFMDDGLKEKARLHTLSILVNEDLSNIFFMDFLLEYQKSSKSLVEKRTMTALDLPYTREVRGSLGINVFGFNKSNVSSLLFSFGLGRYWDPGISLQRKSGTSNRVTGWIFSSKFENPIFGGEIMMNYNYSKELRKLIEATDKFAIECSVYFRI